MQEHTRAGDSIRAVRVHRFGAHPQIDTIAAPAEPGPQELLVDVAALGVGAWDVGVADGRLAALVSKERLPFTMGAELCGRVRALGPDVEGFAVGDRVIANPGVVGAWADRVRLPVAACGRAPSSADDRVAATLPVRGLAAWQSLDLLALPPESVLMVVGAGGGVGRAAVEMARGRGLRVIAIAGVDELERLEQLGADLALDHRTAWKARLASEESQPVEGVLDLVGGPSLAEALDLVRFGGRIVSSVTRQASIPRSRGLEFELLQMRSTPGALGEISRLVDDGGLSTHVTETFAFDDAARALEVMRSPRREPGEVLLLP